jgi:hypothetical protein
MKMSYREVLDMRSSDVNWIIRNLERKQKVKFTYKPQLNPDESLELLPNPKIVSKAIVYHDIDLRTAQYWGSCGVAATITQLRHLNPKRVQRFSILREGNMSISDALDAADFVDEISPKGMLGNPSDFFFDGAAGRPKIDQAWLFAETRNSVIKIEEVLTKRPESNLTLKKHENIDSKERLEEILRKVLGNNHLAYLAIDGAFRYGEDYSFPSSASEWLQRITSDVERPPKEPSPHPILDDLRALIEAECGPLNENDPRNENETKCKHLFGLLDSLKEFKIFHSPTHAVTISGVYESDEYYEIRKSGGREEMRLYRVLDSNPGPNYTDRIRYPTTVSTRQGTVRYMTINELWLHIKEMGSTRILEWTTDGRGICGANKLHPFVWSYGKERLIRQ